jgi:hypothetical protein
MPLQILTMMATDLKVTQIMREFCEDVIHSTKAVIFWGCLSLYKVFWLISQYPMEFNHPDDEDVRLYNERVFVTRVVRGGGRVVYSPTTGRVLPQFHYPPGGVPYHLFQALVEFEMAGVVSVESRCPAFRRLLLINIVQNGRPFSRIVYVQRNRNNEWQFSTFNFLLGDLVNDRGACGAVCQMMNELAVSSRSIHNDLSNTDVRIDIRTCCYIFQIDLRKPVFLNGSLSLRIYLVASETFIRRILLLCRNISAVDNMYQEPNAPILGPYLRGITFRCYVVDHADVTHCLSVALGFGDAHTAIRITSLNVGNIPVYYSDGDSSRSGGDTDNEGVL